MERIFLKSADPDIEQLLGAWLDAVKRYVKLLRDDNCWWHNERANVSTLAGAAWSLPDWVALEEYPTRKYRPDTSYIDKPDIDGRGRCDLYISSPKEDFAFEAKHAWQLIGGPDVVKSAMDAARKDALALRGEADRHFAATFIVPFLPKERLHDDLHEQLSQWLHSQKSITGDTPANIAYAYLFPGMGKASCCNNVYHYPGVMLVLEQVPAN
ncbi:hypothetical protein [Pseudomonas sp. NPDC089734]|uniref:hypothetical protein n=1 Tax=Pseudomonas sp. NPDC089734 TaxID=3364469 RepID=UPI003808ED91